MWKSFAPDTKSAVPAAVDPFLYTHAFHEALGKESFLVGCTSPYDARPVAPTLGRDSATAAAFALLFVLGALILAALKGRLGRAMKSLFLPPRQKTDTQALGSTTRETIILALLRFLLAFSLATMAAVYVSQTLPEGHALTDTRLLLAVFTAAFVVYFTLKSLLYSFTNWIFFERVKNINYKSAATLLTALEGLVFVGLALVSAWGQMETSVLVGMSILSLISVKMLLFYRTRTIFFSKVYCTLHLFVYLCTLEGLSILTLYAVLRQVVSVMTTTN